jgi:hypothetical protein
VRDALGNTSAPWMFVPFLAGTRFARVWHGALAGVATTLAALFGFCLPEAAILDLGPHPWYTDLELTLGSGRVYETWGLVTGSIYGALGAIAFVLAKAQTWAMPLAEQAVSPAEP